MTNYTTNQPWKKSAGIAALFLMALTTSLLAAEAGADSGVEKETMFSLIKKGGPIMIPLGIASIIALALALERFISLRRDRVLPDGFLKGLGDSWDSDPSGQSAEQYCEQSTGSAGHVFKAGLQWRDSGHEAVAKAVEDAGIREADKLKRSLRGLSIIAAVSPLLGLLGTVYGMIDAFQRTSQSGGAAKTADLATGIYEALVTTAAGLTIAIPTLLLYQFLQSRVDKIIDHIDEVGTAFIVNHARKNSASTGSATA
ncbi:MAG TPA: biopolymer transporter ExbB [Verrucomicrobiales bacterium]|nr:biopolymer transporter ExbB [Roseibacillus sp.]HBM78367.1 biopolymer transporter ExbB [Verrucomicrobiales bacterium]|tara:strand:+ start:2059 stop:2826 length:768 start_codon:yes stop_codon:yes gene_type:complete